jgi:aminomethyltransferase
MKFYTFKDCASVGGVDLLLSRTGYTGEDGFELYLPPGDAGHIWDELLKAGKEEGLVPAGLGARDTLRFEACLPLYGQELSEDITPLEAGLDFFVKLSKEDFIGRVSLLEQKEKGLKRKIAGLEMVEKGVPRHGYEVKSQGKSVGVITSGSYAPSLEKYLALALLDIDYVEIGREVHVDIRGKDRLARVAETPFYKRRYKK